MGIGPVEQTNAWAVEAMAAFRRFTGAVMMEMGKVKLSPKERMGSDSGYPESDLPK